MPIKGETKFKFTHSKLKPLSANTANSRSTNQKYSDTEISNLKLLVGRQETKVLSQISN